MTILFMDGMDLHGVSANLNRRYALVTSPAVVYSTTSGRYGGGGITVDDDDKYFEAALPTAPQECVASFAVFSGPVSVVSDVLWRIDSSIGSGGIVFKTSASSALITVHRGVSISIGSFTLPSEQWNWISIKVKMAVTTGTLDIEVNGVNVLSFVGTTRSSGTDICSNLVLGGDQLQDFTYDDIIITDLNGSAPFNALLSDRRIDTILPDATGDSADFTASPAVDNYLNVDESAPDDDTTYVEASVSTDKDLYNMASMGFSPDSIDAVNVVALGRSVDAGGAQVELKVKSGTTEGTGSGQPLMSDYGIIDEQFETNPDTAAAWTESEVNAMQAGMALV